MRAISLWQPWAQWVALSWKTIETRTHNRFASLVGQRIAIHAAQKIDWVWRDKARLSNEQFLWTFGNMLDWPRGAVVCTAQVIEHARLSAVMSPLALCDCSGNDLFGLVLEDVQRFDPIPWKGNQFPFTVPDEVIEKAVKE